LWSFPVDELILGKLGYKKNIWSVYEPYSTKLPAAFNQQACSASYTLPLLFLLARWELGGFLAARVIRLSSYIYEQESCSSAWCCPITLLRWNPHPFVLLENKMRDKDVGVMAPTQEVAVDEIAAQEAVEDERHNTEHEYSGGVLEVSPFYTPY
jgi:hypothetical protein